MSWIRTMSRIVLAESADKKIPLVQLERDLNALIRNKSVLSRKFPGGVRKNNNDELITSEIARGPRLDHGGGPDGDDWLEDWEVDVLRAKYRKKFDIYLDQIVKYIREAGYPKARARLDIGEKGHVTATFLLNP